MSMTIMWQVPGAPTGEQGEYTIDGRASYDPGTPRSYSSGGSPDGWDVEDYTVTDWDGNDVTEQMCQDAAFVREVEDRLITEAQDRRSEGW